jgi:hypothetical protein
VLLGGYAITKTISREAWDAFRLGTNEQATASLCKTDRPSLRQSCVAKGRLLKVPKGITMHFVIAVTLGDRDCAREPNYDDPRPINTQYISSERRKSNG